MLIQEDFTFNNLHCIALSTAKASDPGLTRVQRSLLGELVDGLENIPLNHNVRSSLLATGIYVIYSNGRVSLIGAFSMLNSFLSRYLGPRFRF